MHDVTDHSLASDKSLDVSSSMVNNPHSQRLSISIPPISRLILVWRMLAISGLHSECLTRELTSLAARTLDG